MSQEIIQPKVISIEDSDKTHQEMHKSIFKLSKTLHLLTQSVQNCDISFHFAIRNGLVVNEQNNFNINYPGKESFLCRLTSEIPKPISAEDINQQLISREYVEIYFGVVAKQYRYECNKIKLPINEFDRTIDNKQLSVNVFSEIMGKNKSYYELLSIESMQKILQDKIKKEKYLRRFMLCKLNYFIKSIGWEHENLTAKEGAKELEIFIIFNNVASMTTLKLENIDQLTKIIQDSKTNKVIRIVVNN